MKRLADGYANLERKGRSTEVIARLFESGQDELGSYLLDITVDILRKKEGGNYLLDHILDKAGNKGTGSWTTVSITELGIPATMIPAALLARYLSFFKAKREETSHVFPTPAIDEDISVSQLKKAYQFSRIINHQQGFSIIAQASQRYQWQVNLSEIARIWTEGCIIKSDLMKELVDDLQADHDLLQHAKVVERIKETHPAAKAIAMACIKHEIHAPCLLESANFFHGMKTARISANLIQAQRDYFGAHTYQRLDDPSGKSYHTEW